MERDFTLDGKMKPIADKATKKGLRGYLPFFSVDTKEQADAVIAAAIERGEFYVQADGGIVETTLLQEQTLENLQLAGERLAAIAGELGIGET